MDPRAEDLTRFWLDEVGEDGWYAQDDALDTRIRERWLPLWEEARDRRSARLALQRRAARWRCCVLLDQFPRNMFRGEPARLRHRHPRAAAAPRTRSLRGFDKRVPTARAPVLLPAARALGTAVRPGLRRCGWRCVSFGRDSELLRHAAPTAR